MSENPDSEVIKTIMAIVNHPDRWDEPYHIVAEIGEPDHVEAAMVVGGNEVEWCCGYFVSRVIAQTCRQSVYQLSLPICWILKVMKSTSPRHRTSLENHWDAIRASRTMRSWVSNHPIPAPFSIHPWG
jgi:hypothetical protein